MNPNSHIKTGHQNQGITRINTTALEISKKEKELRTFYEVMERVARKLTNLRKHTPLVVTDHALIRYLEMVKGINMDDVRKEMVTPTLANYYKTLGDGEFPMEQDSMVRAIIKDATIITIVK